MFKYYEPNFNTFEGCAYEWVSREEALCRMRHGRKIIVIHLINNCSNLDLHYPHVRWDGTKLVADAHYRGGSPFGEIEEEDLPF